MKDADLVRQFEDCTLPSKDFNHRNHARLAWICLQDHGLLQALKLFPENLKNFAASLGAANLYHETVTFAYLFLIHERIKRSSIGQENWEEFAVANDDLFVRRTYGILTNYYRAETLASDFAKNVFVLPDKTEGE